jgi:hypothetical protein
VYSARRQANGEGDEVLSLGHGEEIGNDRVVRPCHALAEELTPGDADRIRNRRRGLEDGGAAADMGVNQAEGLELAIGVEDRAPVHAKGGRQPAFGRQQKTLRQRPGADQPLNLPYDLSKDRLAAVSINRDVQ